jgi:hypothetical protein
VPAAHSVKKAARRCAKASNVCSKLKRPDSARRVLCHRQRPPGERERSGRMPAATTPTPSAAWRMPAAVRFARELSLTNARVRTKATSRGRTGRNAARLATREKAAPVFSRKQRNRRSVNEEESAHRTAVRTTRRTRSRSPSPAAERPPACPGTQRRVAACAESRGMPPPPR